MNTIWQHIWGPKVRILHILVFLHKLNDVIGRNRDVTKRKILPSYTKKVLKLSYLMYNIKANTCFILKNQSCCVYDGHYSLRTITRVVIVCFVDMHTKYILCSADALSFFLLFFTLFWTGDLFGYRNHIKQKLFFKIPWEASIPRYKYCLKIFFNTRGSAMAIVQVIGKTSLCKLFLGNFLPSISESAA